MLLIVAHHSIVNSGVNELFDFSTMPSARQLFCQWFGMWGKMAINIFVLFSGYFMCKSRLTLGRALKLFLEVQFYAISLFVVLWLLGYESISVKRVFSLLNWFPMGINKSFTSSFLLFYLFIPFYNDLISALDSGRMLILTLGLVLSFVIPFTFFGNHGVFCWSLWYVAIYFTGAYVRLYPSSWMSRNRICVPLLSLFLCGTISGVWIYSWNMSHSCGLPLKIVSTFFGIAESCSLTAWVLGLLFFLVFKNLKMPYIPFINAVASTTFGVLLIHTAGDSMRQLIWGSVVDVIGHYQDIDCCYELYMVVAVVGVFVLCSVLDYVRIVLFERPFFRWFDGFRNLKTSQPRNSETLKL